MGKATEYCGNPLGLEDHNKNVAAKNKVPGSTVAECRELKIELNCEANDKVCTRCHFHIGKMIKNIKNPGMEQRKKVKLGKRRHAENSPGDGAVAVPTVTHTFVSRNKISCMFLGPSMGPYRIL